MERRAAFDRSEALDSCELRLARHVDQLHVQCCQRKRVLAHTDKLDLATDLLRLHASGCGRNARDEQDERTRARRNHSPDSSHERTTFRRYPCEGTAFRL